MADMKKKADEELASALSAVEKKLIGRAEEYNKARNELKMEIAELMQQLADKDVMVTRANEETRKVETELESAGRRAEAELSLVQDQVSVLMDQINGSKAEARAAREEAATARSEMVGAAAKVEALKRDVETHKKQADAREAGFKETLAAELRRCDEEWARRAEDRGKELTAELVEAHNLELESTMMRIEKERTDALNEQRDSLQAAVHAERERLQGIIDEERSNAQAERERHAEELKTAINTKEAEKAEIIADAAEKAAAAADEASRRSEEAAAVHADAMQTLRDETKAASAAAALKREADLSQERTERVREVDECKRAHREEVKATVAEWTEANAKLEERLDGERRRALDSLEAALREEFDNRERSATKKAETEKAVRDKRIEELQELSDARAKNISDLESEVAKLASDLNDERSALGAKTVELSDTIERMASEREFSAQAIRAEAEAARAHLEQQHLAALELERSERAAEKKEADELQAETVARLEDVTERFEARESRAEDVETIRALEATIKAKDEEYEGLMSEARNIRNEAMNREETYNKNFKSGGASAMNVACSGGGMMEVFLAKKAAKRLAQPARR